MVAFWGVRLKPLPGAPGSGPLRELPSAKAMQESFRQTWLGDFALRNDESILSERCFPMSNFTSRVLRLSRRADQISGRGLRVTFYAILHRS